MNIDLRPFVAIWAALAAVVVVLIVRRKMVTHGESDSVHVLDTAVSASSHQVMVAQRLEVIDRWGKILTAVALIYGLALAAAYAYQIYMANSGIPTGA
jgi:hypothetical protein